jgi:hypothetical protein
MQQSIFVLLAASTLVAGCMTSSPGSYQPPTSASHFVLEQDTMVTNKISSGLAKGRYQAVFQKNGLTYYLGEPKSLIMPNGVRVNGGIALPAEKSGECHMFIQVGDDSEVIRAENGGELIAQLSKLEAGRIREFPGDPACAGFYPHVMIVVD